MIARFALLVVLSVAGAACSAAMMGNRGMMNGRMADRTASAPNQDDARVGSELIYRYCAGCHLAPNPTQHSAHDWPRVVKRMEGYMRSRGWSAPGNQQLQLITDYLEKHAADAHPGED